MFERCVVHPFGGSGSAAVAVAASSSRWERRRPSRPAPRVGFGFHARRCFRLPHGERLPDRRWRFRTSPTSTDPRGGRLQLHPRCGPALPGRLLTGTGCPVGHGGASCRARRSSARALSAKPRSRRPRDGTPSSCRRTSTVRATPTTSRSPLADDRLDAGHRGRHPRASRTFGYKASAADRRPSTSAPDRSARRASSWMRDEAWPS